MANTGPSHQDIPEMALDVRLNGHSPTEFNDNASHLLAMRSMESHDTAYDLSQSADMSSRFEDSNKMYICHLCDFRTAFRNSLLNHQAVHSDFRPWVCAVCEYAAKRKQDLKKHLHTIHGLMVESTMLKPIGVPHSNLSGSLSRGESGEDNSWDETKAIKLSEIDSAHPNSHFLQPMAEISPHMPGPADMLAMSVKQEKLEPDCLKPLPSMSNFISRSPSESDCELPISFSPSLPSKDDIPPKLSESSSHLYKTCNNTEKSRFTKDYKPTLGQQKQQSDIDSNCQSISNSSRKRPRSYIQDSQPFMDTSHEYANPMLIKPGKNVHVEDLACSSSMDISHSKANQTQTSFMCEFCDIMFFQRAMYLMHAGLHSPDNPWCCAVCGSTFTEKYSFTSHFINQH